MRTTRSLCCMGALALAAITGGRMFSPAIVRGESMAPTLHNGAVLLVDRTCYLSQPPRPGEVIVFRHEGETYVKRVYAGPGESFHYVEASGEMLAPVRKDRVELARRYYRSPHSVLKLRRLQVPDDAVFVIGDNWSNSVDSRSFGPVSLKSVIGRARMNADATVITRHEMAPRLPARKASAEGQGPRSPSSLRPEAS